VTILARKSVKLLSLIVTIVLTTLTLFVIYDNYRGAGILVDAVIEIGDGGIHRNYSSFQTLGKPYLPLDLLQPIEWGGDLMENLDIRYGFNKDENPRLIRRINKMQLRNYGKVIHLTVEGDDTESAIAYMDEILLWIKKRHDEIYEKRRIYSDKYLHELDAVYLNWINKCGDLEGVTVEVGWPKWLQADRSDLCTKEKLRLLVFFSLYSNYHLSDFSRKKTSIALASTKR